MGREDQAGVGERLPACVDVIYQRIDEAGVVHRWHESLSGEAWEQGPVILSWDVAVSADARTNIVLQKVPAMQIDPAIQQRSIGEAEFLRAKFYFGKRIKT